MHKTSLSAVLVALLAGTTAQAAKPPGRAVPKQVKSPTKEKNKAEKRTAERPVCMRPPIEVSSHLSELDSVVLTRCDGKLAPGAVEKMSVAARPGSVPRPEQIVPAKTSSRKLPLLTASTGERAQKPSPNVAPGVRRIDAGLVERLALAAEHFAKNGKPPRVLVVSGYRPSSAGSYHASGRALDFRLEGVDNKDLVAFCKTLTDTGCGFYPNSLFVHMDVRDAGAGHVSWIDASGPGERPRYVASWPPPPAQAAPSRESVTGLEKLERELSAPLPGDEHPAIAAEAGTETTVLAPAPRPEPEEDIDGLRELER